MKLTADQAEVDVPGSIVGLGTGYSTLTVATDPTDHYTLRAVAGVSQVSGIGLGARPTNPEKHPTVVAVRALLDRAGSPQVGVHLSVRAKIPRGSGLGAYDAEIVAGLVAATRMLGSPDALDTGFLLGMAEELGASRQRALAALTGRCFLRLSADREVPIRASAESQLAITAFVPGFSLDERIEDDSEPRTVRYTDAARSASSLALQTALISGSVPADAQVLMDATDNALRAEVGGVRSPASHSLVKWLREQAVAAFVCGAGPAVIAYGAVPSTVSDAAVTSGWTPLSLGIATTGALDTPL